MCFHSDLTVALSLEYELGSFCKSWFVMLVRVLTGIVLVSNYMLCVCDYLCFMTVYLVDKLMLGGIRVLVK